MKILSVVLPEKTEANKVGQVADNAAKIKYGVFRQAAAVRGSKQAHTLTIESIVRLLFYWFSLSPGLDHALS